MDSTILLECLPCRWVDSFFSSFWGGLIFGPEGFLCGWNILSSSSAVQENTLRRVWTYCFLIFNYDDLLGGFSFGSFKWKGYHRPSLSLSNPNLQPKTPTGCIETRGICLAFWANSLALVNILSAQTPKGYTTPSIYLWEGGRQCAMTQITIILFGSDCHSGRAE